MLAWQELQVRMHSQTIFPVYLHINERHVEFISAFTIHRR